MSLTARQRREESLEGQRPGCISAAERVLKNANVDRLLEIEREKGAELTIDDIHDQVAGVYPKIMLDGQMDAGAWSCGMVAGLIHDIPSCKELVDRIMNEAEQIIRNRLMGSWMGRVRRERSPDTAKLLNHGGTWPLELHATPPK